MSSPELFDVVELLLNLPEQGLQVGAQGAIVDIYDDGSCEVEFANGAGEMRRWWRRCRRRRCWRCLILRGLFIVGGWRVELSAIGSLRRAIGVWV
jgi:Domain of unknown function (DUF4926)